jgi:AcrR family transcriptional regulator
MSTQAERRARSRTAFLESAAVGISRVGYGNLSLEQVARDAGYSRGALYHQFRDKEELTLAVLEWIQHAWAAAVGTQVAAESDPSVALVTLARAHAVFCRRDFARVAIALRVEFTGQDHPVGRAVEAAYDVLTKTCTRYVTAARAAGAIPPGPSDTVLARGFIGALEGTVVALAGTAPYDEELAARAVAGVLGLPHYREQDT